MVSMAAFADEMLKIGAVGLPRELWPIITGSVLPVARKVGWKAPTLLASGGLMYAGGRRAIENQMMAERMREQMGM